jgi:hypothetical protein
MFHGTNSRPSIRMVCEHVFFHHIYYFIRTIIIARTFFLLLWPVLCPPIWLITGCISLRIPSKVPIQIVWRKDFIIIGLSSEVRLFVPPFEVTILNHSPRLILAVPSKVSVQKTNPFSDFHLWPHMVHHWWYWGNHDAKLRACHCRLYSKAIFLAVATPQAQNLLPLLIFS